MTANANKADRWLWGLFLLVAAAAGAGATPAAAFSPLDAASLFGTEYGDGFTSVFLNQIFGPIFPSAAGGVSQTVFSTIIGYFNVIMLVIGGILFFYNATIGLLQSAHEGSVLGQRWSSLWAPLRILFAVGLLVPMPGLGGYNLVQAGVAYTVKGSTNVASAVWSTSAALVISGQMPVTTEPPTIPSDVMRVLYENAACETLVDYHMGLAARTGSEPLRVGERITEQEGQLTRETFLISSGAETRHGICGGFLTPPLPDYILRIENNPGSIMGIPDSSRAQIETAFASTHLSAMNVAMTEFRAVTDSMLPVILDNAQEPPSIRADITRIYQGANQRLSVFVQEIMTLALGADRDGQPARDALLSRITGDCMDSGSGENVTACYGEGWIGAGSWYMMIAQLNNEISSLTSAVPSAFPGNYIRSSSSPSEREYSEVTGGESSRGWNPFRRSDNVPDPTGLSHLMDRYMVAFDRSAAGLAVFGFPVSRENLHTLSDGNPSTVLSKVPYFSRWVQSARDNLLVWFSPGGGTFGSDPMIALSVIGQWLITGSGFILAAGIGGGFLSGGALGTMLTPLFVALLTSGATLSMLLPIMPFVFWVLAVTGYFILVVEAMIAVNLWAIAHMRMDGEGISGEAGRNGWLMILSLVMTPVLMVFGFLIGMTIFRVTSALLDIGLFQALSGILGGNILINLVAIVTFGIFMAIFYMVLLERSFSLVSEFPGRVLRWMGGSAQLTNGEEGKVRMAAVGAGLAVARGSGSINAASSQTAGRLGLGRGGAKGNPRGDIGGMGLARQWLVGRNNNAKEGPMDGGPTGPKSGG